MVNKHYYNKLTSQKHDMSKRWSCPDYKNPLL